MKIFDEKPAKKNNLQQLLFHKKVIVNIWFPRVDGIKCAVTEVAKIIKARSRSNQDTSDCYVGHISLQTPNIYASWWPADGGEGVGIFNVINREKGNFVDDCYSEGNHPPDLRVCFYSLDILKIEACYQKIENSDEGYVLAGDKKVTRLFNERKGQSCCGLAYELLEEGGILNLSHSYRDLIAKWIILTPDNFAEFVKNAKQLELIMYPETKNFPAISREYLPDSQLTSSYCSVM